MHHTLHAPSGTTVTFSWTPAGYDAVAFFSDGCRASLIDDVTDPRSLWTTARWIVETAAGLGGVDDLGEVLVALLDDAEVAEAVAGSEISQLVEQLRRMRA